MAWYVYKCNSRNQSHQNHFGDWADFFRLAVLDKDVEWGTDSIVPALGRLAPGDMILAYQTDRNELVGLAQVTRWKGKSGHDYVYMKAIRRIGVRVRPLKWDPRIAAIHAFRTNEVKTLYDITKAEAEYLIAAAESAPGTRYPAQVVTHSASATRPKLRESSPPKPPVFRATAKQVERLAELGVSKETAQQWTLEKANEVIEAIRTGKYKPAPPPPRPTTAEGSRSSGGSAKKSPQGRKQKPKRATAKPRKQQASVKSSKHSKLRRRIRRRPR